MDLEKISLNIERNINEIVNYVLEQNLRDTGVFSFTFNANQLTPYKVGCQEAYEMACFKALFEKLETLNTHCIYWFEVPNSQQCLKLIELLDAYRANKKRNQNYRTVPAKALKRYDCSNSNIVYLGVRRGKGENAKPRHTNIAQRINQHLGYYKTNATQGLQLSSYAAGKDIQITFKVQQLDGLQEDYLNLIEKALARKVNPHCGRH